MSQRHLIVLALFTLVSPVLAQESAEEQAQRLLAEGRSYRDQGKPKQALENFNIVIASFPGTGAVGTALLEIGRYRMEVDRDDAAARQAFELVSREHAQSEAAPGAYHYLGLLTLQAATTPAQLDEALAQFTRVATLYPRSDWVPRSLQASAMVHRRAGRFEDAVTFNRRVALEYPASDAAPRAQFEAGHALGLLGRPRLAMEAFQQVRNRFPDSPWAATALDRTTALYRLYGQAKPTFAVDSSFSLSGGDVLKDVKALLMAPGNRLWIASKKTKSAVVFESGKMGRSLGARDPRTLSLSLTGEVVFAAKTAVRIGPRDVRSFYLPPEKVGAQRKPLEKILAAAVTPGDAVVVSDEKNDRVYRFSAAGKLLGPFIPRDSAKRKVTRIIVDGEGAILLLDRKQKMVLVCTEAGRTIRTVGPGGLRKPADVAVDTVRNIYVADEAEGVVVFNPKGELLFKIKSPDLKKATAITIEDSGAVLVYDSGSKRILRYR